MPESGTPCPSGPLMVSLTHDLRTVMPLLRLPRRMTFHLQVYPGMQSATRTARKIQKTNVPFKAVNHVLEIAHGIRASSSLDLSATPLALKRNVFRTAVAEIPSR